MKMKSQILYLH